MRQEPERHFWNGVFCTVLYAVLGPWFKTGFFRTAVSHISELHYEDFNHKYFLVNYQYFANENERYIANGNCCIFFYFPENTPGPEARAGGRGTGYRWEVYYLSINAGGWRGCQVGLVTMLMTMLLSWDIWCQNRLQFADLCIYGNSY